MQLFASDVCVLQIFGLFRETLCLVFQLLGETVALHLALPASDGRSSEVVKKKSQPQQGPCSMLTSKLFTLFTEILKSNHNLLESKEGGKDFDLSLKMRFNCPSTLL
jgi:hypothetical protein